MYDPSSIGLLAPQYLGKYIHVYGKHIYMHIERCNTYIIIYSGLQQYIMYMNKHLHVLIDGCLSYSNTNTNILYNELHHRDVVQQATATDNLTTHLAADTHSNTNTNILYNELYSVQVHWAGVIPIYMYMYMYLK